MQRSVPEPVSQTFSVTARGLRRGTGCCPGSCERQPRHHGDRARNDQSERCGVCDIGTQRRRDRDERRQKRGECEVPPESEFAPHPGTPAGGRGLSSPQDPYGWAAPRFGVCGSASAGRLLRALGCVPGSVLVRHWVSCWAVDGVRTCRRLAGVRRRWPGVHRSGSNATSSSGVSPVAMRRASSFAVRGPSAIPHMP